MFKKFILFFFVLICIPFSISVDDTEENIDMYSTANIIDLDKTSIYFDTKNSPDTKGNISINVEGDDYIYKTGYYLDVKYNMWNPFTFDEETYKKTDWIQDSASKLVSLDRYDLGLIDYATTVTTYIAAYACSKKNGKWDCHDGKWVIKEFTATIVPDDCEEQGENWLSVKCPVMIKASGKNHIFELWDVGNSSSNGESKLFCDIRMDDRDYKHYFLNEQKTENDVDIKVTQAESSSTNSTERCKIDVK